MYDLLPPEGILRAYLGLSISGLKAAADDKIMRAAFEDTVAACLLAIRSGGKVVLAGNGGSFADAQHFAGELVGAYRNRSRPPIPAVVLGSEGPTLTAISNDEDYEFALRRIAEVTVKKEDAVIALSTSGTSSNIMHMLAHVRALAWTGLWTSSRVPPSKDCVACTVLKVPSNDTPIIQQVHAALLHCMAGILEDELS